MIETDHKEKFISLKTKTIKFVVLHQTNLSVGFIFSFWMKNFQRISLCGVWIPRAAHFGISVFSFSILLYSLNFVNDVRKSAAAKCCTSAETLRTKHWIEIVIATGRQIVSTTQPKLNQKCRQLSKFVQATNTGQKHIIKVESAVPVKLKPVKYPTGRISKSPWKPWNTIQFCQDWYIVAYN